MRGVPVIILWTRGRSTGAIRKTPLMRVRDDLRVSLQDGPDAKGYTTREVTEEEKAEWWGKATAVWPDYDAYQAKTDREIPVVVLEPVGS